MARKCFDGGNSAHLSPVGAIGGEREAHVVVGNLRNRRELRAIGKGSVVDGEAVFSEGGRGDNEDRTDSEAEEKNWAVLGGETGQGLVEGLLEEAEMTKDGKGIRKSWREILLQALFVGYEEFDWYEEGEKEN